MSALTRYPVPQGTAAGAVGGPRLSFRLEPTIVPDPVLDFLQPLRGVESIKAGAVDDPRLYFRLEAAVPTGRIWNLIGPSGLIGHGGGLVR